MTILPPIYGFSEQLRRMADQIACSCPTHRQIKTSLYQIAKRAEEAPATLHHIAEEHKKLKFRRRRERL